jgi:hypothetical protein
LAPPTRTSPVMGLPPSTTIASTLSGTFLGTESAARWPSP